MARNRALKQKKISDETRTFALKNARLRWYIEKI